MGNGIKMSIMKIETTKTVKVQGNSLVLVLTKELKLLDLKEGDVVKVTLEKIE